MNLGGWKDWAPRITILSEEEFLSEDEDSGSYCNPDDRRMYFVCKNGAGFELDCLSIQSGLEQADGSVLWFGIRPRTS